MLNRVGTHPNIVEFVSASWDTPPFVCILLEYVGGGTLGNLLYLDTTEELSGAEFWVEKGLSAIAQDIAGASGSCLTESIVAEST